MSHLRKPIGSTRSTKTTTLLLTALCCLALSLLSTPAPAQDQVGIYWDQDYSQTTLTQDPVPGSATGYLVITDPSVPGGIVGWELCTEKTGGGFIYSWALAGQAFNLESEPCFSVGLTEPLLPTGNAILLATFQTYLSDGEPVSFYLSHIPSPLGGQMSYTPAADPRYPVELSTAAGEAYPVAQILSNAPWAIFSTQALEFGTHSIHRVVDQNIRIENGGGGDLELDIRLSQDCVGFSLTSVVGLVTVSPGATLVVPITFTALAAEAYSCNVEFGGTLPTVSLTGAGRQANYQYTLSADIEFGEVFVGDNRDMIVEIRSTGLDPIPVVPELLGCGSEFVIISGGESAILNWHQTQTVVVRFQPTSEDTFDCALSFGPDIDQVGLMGSARASGLDYIVPADMDFGEVEAGGYTIQTASIHNNGTIGFTIAPSLVGCGDDFAITWGGEVGTVRPGQTRRVGVRFQPGSDGDFSCALALGAVLPDIQLLGYGTPAVARWWVSPTVLQFRSVLEGDTSEMAVRVTNTGIVNIDLDVQLLNATPGFTIVEGGGVVDLVANSEHQVLVRFNPEGPGAFADVLDFGSIVRPVNVTGVAYAHSDSCGMSESELGFGNTLVSIPTVRTFLVSNLGTMPLSVTPASDSPYFVVSTTPFTMEPRSVRALTVTFTADDVGPYEGTISMGNAICSEIFCHGLAARPVEPDPDDLGIFFDEGFSINTIYPTVAVPFNAYLVLFNPSDPSPIAGWECKLEIEGQIFILSQYFNGPATNSGTSPDFVVSYAEPLPSAAAVKLLTFNMMTISMSDVVTFSLSPTSNPSSPGQMSWTTEAPQALIRMNTSTGVPLVATVYDEAPVGLEVPSPVLSRQGGQVHLSWPAPLQPGSGCHVYRRTAIGLEDRLTSQPLNTGSGTLEYTDNPTGFDAGTTLFYSYAIIVDGTEQSRSLEVEYTFETPRILASRLLPNVPNPFNPMTKIRFELAKNSDVQVSVFDVTGRLVKVLESGNLAAGEYSRTWQGRDESGRPVASGAYYVRLVLDNKVDHQKIMLLK